jgi:SAM-dependent methyltransferase
MRAHLRATARARKTAGKLRRWLIRHPLRYRGSSVVCPLCGGSFRRFMPQRGRPQALCPNPECRTVERHRILWFFLEREVRIAGLDVLHFAPEPSLEARIRSAPGVRYTSVDLDSPLAMVHADITALPFEDASFDLIVCSHVLEHVSDDARALSELRRVLRPEGSAVLLYPVDLSRDETYEDDSIVDPEARLRAFGQRDHVRWYGRDHLERLRSAGFDVGERRYLEELDGETRRVSGLWLADGDGSPEGSIEFATIFHCRPSSAIREARRSAA